MEWIEGEPLNTYIAKNLGQPHKLLQLSRDWSEMMASLRAAQIAHGDLQHGNILVTPTGLRLIDYDGMYVPSLNGCVSHEEGHRNYQHPERTGRDFGPYLDNFSAWVIFSSVMLVALEPRLWQLLKGGDECLLFRRDDFKRPDRSSAFQVLESSSPEVKALAGQFRSLLSMPLRQIPALDGRVVVQTTPAPQRTTVPGAVPDWLAGHIAPMSQSTAVATKQVIAEDEGPAMVATADWIIDHLVDSETPIPTLRAHSFVVERLALLLTLCVSVVAGWSAAVSFIPIATGMVFIAVTVGAYSILLMARYRRASGMKERREIVISLRTARDTAERQQAEIKVALSKRKKLALPLEALEAEFRALPAKINEEIFAMQVRIDGIHGSYSNKRQELADEESQAIRHVEDEARRRLGPLQIERNGIDQKERTEVAKAINAVQEAYINSRLANATIDGASLMGIGPKLKATLKAHGIYSARDVDSWRIRNVRGIGEAKQAELMAWRSQIIYDTPVQASLSRDQELNIRNQFVRRRNELDQQLRQSKSQSGGNAKPRSIDSRRAK